MTLTYMSENGNGGPAAIADVQTWANMYSQNGLVVFSGIQTVWYPFGVDQGGGNWSISLPGTMLVGTGAAVASMGQPSNAQIEAQLP